MSTLETTEIRWFAPGSLPAGLHRWFIGATARVEVRRDVYLLAGRPGEGVKYRGGRTLELKVRQRIGSLIDFDDDLTGRTEEWRKWTPADALVETSPSQRWVGVDKMILKRRFSLTGVERAFANDPDEVRACDIEIADVRLGDVTAWTLAIAAYGPVSAPGAVLATCWEGLKAATPGTMLFELDAGRAMSYPEWLACTIRGHVRDPSRGTT